MKKEYSYRYDLFSYKFLNSNYECECLKGFNIDKSPFKVNKDKKISFNCNIYKRKFQLLNKIESIPIISIHNYLLENYMKDLEKNYNWNRRYFNYNIIKFCSKKNIETWMDIDTGITNNENTKTRTTNYQQIIDKINKKSIFLNIDQYDKDTELPNYKEKRILFISNWMEMNEEEEMVNYSKLDLDPEADPEFWFFPEFVETL